MTISLRPRVLAASAAVLLAAGCSVLGLDYDREPANLEYSEFHPVSVTLPDSVTAGQAFTVEVASYGGGCIEKDDAEVRVDGLAADVSVFHRRPTGDRSCHFGIDVLRHEARVTFRERGAATVRVHGRGPAAQPMTVTRTVVVR